MLSFPHVLYVAVLKVTQGHFHPGSLGLWLPDLHHLPVQTLLGAQPALGCAGMSFFLSSLKTQKASTSHLHTQKSAPKIQVKFSTTWTASPSPVLA